MRRTINRRWALAAKRLRVGRFLGRDTWLLSAEDEAAIVAVVSGRVPLPPPLRPLAKVLTFTPRPRVEVPTTLRQARERAARRELVKAARYALHLAAKGVPRFDAHRRAANYFGVPGTDLDAELRRTTRGEGGA